MVVKFLIAAQLICGFKCKQLLVRAVRCAMKAKNLELVTEQSKKKTNGLRIANN